MYLQMYLLTFKIECSHFKNNVFEYFSMCRCFVFKSKFLSFLYTILLYTIYIDMMALKYCQNRSSTAIALNCGPISRRYSIMGYSAYRNRNCRLPFCSP